MKFLLFCLLLALSLAKPFSYGEPGDEVKTVSVSGNVRSPQALPWSPELTLTRAIKRAGGVAWETGNSVAEIRRGTERIRVKLRTLKREEDIPRLKPGDLVLVDPEPEDG